MSSLRRQSGEGKAGCIFWIVLVLIGGLIAAQWIPAKIADVQLRDHMDELAKLYPRATGKVFRDEILKRAEDLEIPLKGENVQVEKNLRRVRMRISYTRQLNLIVTTYDLKFEHDMERDIYIM